MTKNAHFDYIIIGNGLAGLQLALKMASDSFFEDKQIALIDPSEKNTNDKTWSFWEKGLSQWKSIIHKSWNKATVCATYKTIDLNLNPYSYNSIRSIDFYEYAKSALSKHENFKFIIEKVHDVEDIKPAIVKTSKHVYTSNHVFDSRIPQTFTSKSNNYISILQHFKGLVIQSDDNCFDEDIVTMMDYRLKDGNQTTFTYVLPFSPNTALIEFTYFTSEIVSEQIYDKYIKTYINDFLKIDSYTVIEEEKGVIPMTTFPFEKFNSQNITKIGTGGGWVKGSSGYSFKNTEKKVSTIIGNIKNNKTPSKQLFKRKYKFYDKVFLKVLKDENHKGEWIFEQFYDKNSVQTMFRFLDEESTFFEDLKIMSSLFSLSFIKAFFKTL